MKTKYILTIIILLYGMTNTFATRYTWVGNTSTSWSVSSNWNPSTGVPDSSDNVSISTGTYNLALDQNRKVTNLTLTSKIINLSTYTLTVYGTATMNSGTVTNGTFKCRGTLASFKGTLMDCPVDAICGYIQLSGSTFNDVADFTDQGTASGTGAGGCTFNGNVTITHTGSNNYFTLANTTGDIFNANVTFSNSNTHELNVSTNGNTTFNGNIIVNCTGGGILFGNSGGTSTLATGKTITVGSTGFTIDYLTLKNFTQTGSTAQTLTLTGTAIVNMISCTFNGNLTITAPGFLLKNSTFNGTATLTRNGSSGNHQSDGGNYFSNSLNLNNSGNNGRIRFATTTGDIFNDNVILNSSGSQDVQLCYTGNSYFYGDITINSNKVVFNTSNGKVTFAGGNSQTLNGSYNYSFKKLTINKSASQVIANSTLSVDDTLFLVKGILLTKGSNLLTMKLGSKVTGASDSSYVEGPVKKTGNSAFIFPCGANNSYRPIEMSAPSTTSSEFVGEFVEDSLLVNNVQRDSSLGFLIRNKYWKLNRTSGTSQVYVTLSWDSLNALADTFVNVTSWNGSQWKNLGKGIVNGNKMSGSIKSMLVATSYAEFALGYFSNEALPTPLPCDNVNNVSDLIGCLINPPLSHEILITGSFAIDDPLPFSSFPLIIQSDIKLESWNGTSSFKWWELNCPLLTSNHIASYIDNVCGCDNPTCSNMCRRDAFYLFELQAGATIEGLRIRGANTFFKDFNLGDLECGGIYVGPGGSGTTATTATINNCELTGFSDTGIWKIVLPETLKVENCFIQKINGDNLLPMGYGIWVQSDKIDQQKMDFTNSIFDDCKTAIDGQGHACNWTVDKCCFTQFFASEDINMHNYNVFHTADPSAVSPDEYFYCYNNTLSPCYSDPELFYGPFCNTGPKTCQTLNLISSPSSPLQWLDFSSTSGGIPIYDVGGANTVVQNSIFHKKRTLDENGNGNINLCFPNRDISKYGIASNGITISNNTFATKRFSIDDLKDVNNLGGYAKVADNNIDACLWKGDIHLISSGNSFGYKLGSTLSSSTSSVPCELSLDLKSGGNSLDNSHTISPSSQKKFIQHIEAGNQITIDATISNATNQFFIIRPNSNENSPGGIYESHVISNQNYFYDFESYASGSTPYTYNQPGLYGIDVLGFDVLADINGKYNFRASAWQHIPVIVTHPTEEQVLYFNIKDSFKESIATSTGVFKEVYLNNTMIWSEDIGNGGDGWEYVKVDLKDDVPGTTDPIKSIIFTDGRPNKLSFGVRMVASIDTTVLKGLWVWVDDVYIKKSGSSAGDNLIRDGSIERILKEGSLLTGEAEDRLWFQDISSSASCLHTDASISSLERKSGSYAIGMHINRENCSPYSYSNATVISVGTDIDFTDFFTCADVIPVSSTIPSPMGFIEFPSGPFGSGATTLTSGTKYYLNGNITLTSGEELNFNGNLVAIAPDVKITVVGGSTLKINHGTHLFACGDMWEGIENVDGEIDAYTGADGNSFSKIEDAKYPITSNGGKTRILFTTFDNNLNGVRIINEPGHIVNTASKIQGSNFLCTDGVINKSPGEYKIPYAHLTLKDINNFDFNIGYGHNTRNLFEDACIGILLQNSNAKIRNCYFTNIYNRNDIFPPATLSSAILIRNNARVYNLNVEIGGSNVVNDHEKNYFTNVNIGIYANTWNSNSLKILGNKFDNSNFSMTPLNTIFYNSAITIQSPTHAYSHNEERVANIGHYQIYDNEITDFRIGIFAGRLRNLRVGTDENDVEWPNKINFHLGSDPGTSENYAGIWLQNCRDSYVNGSHGTTSTDMDIENDIQVTATGITNFRGIDIENSTNTRLNCNKIKNISRSITFTGNCDGSLLRRNYMENYEVGVDNYLSVIGNQGFLNSSNDWEALDNEWINPLNNKRVGGNFNQTQGFVDWYYKTTSPTLEPVPNDGGFTLQPSIYGSAQCTDYLPQQRDALYGAVIADTLSFEEYSEAYSFLVKFSSFETFKSDTTILDEGRGSDSLFHSYYDSTEASIIGQFNKVIELAEDSSTLTLAIEGLEFIYPTNTIEENLKTVLTIYLTKILTGDTLSTDDSTSLAEIATKDWVEGGMAIYMAASILGIEIHPQIISERLAGNGSNHQEIILPAVPVLEDLNINLHPNPANETLFVKGINESEALITIFDMEGKLVLSKNVTGNCQLDISMLHNGIYRLNVQFKNGDTCNQKFIKFKL